MFNDFSCPIKFIKSMTNTLISLSCNLKLMYFFSKKNLLKKALCGFYEHSPYQLESADSGRCEDLLLRERRQFLS